MIKNNLGKIILSILFLAIPSIVNAKVLLQAPNTFYSGDIVTFKLIASGSEIKIPEINTIDGSSVSNAGTSRNITIVNSKKSFQLEKAYSLVSKTDIHIPSFEILIDNKIEKTEAKTIKMLKVEKTKSDLYDLEIKVDKKDAYVGEAIEFTLKFKYKKDLEIVGLNFNKPSFENFWVKELQPQKSQNSYTKYVEQELKYLLFPQKEGRVELEPLKIVVSTVQSNYGRGFFLSAPTLNTPVYSNKLVLNIKKLPENVNLIGDFAIRSTIDKTTIDQGDAVSFNLYITGRGNIDDLDEVKLDIPNTTIYDNPSQKEYDIKDNIYGGKYSKTYSIVGKDDFTIPSIEVKYFDKKSGTVKIVKTKQYDITVNKKVLKEVKLEVADVPRPQIKKEEQKKYTNRDK
ncbi:BatD family protein [Arcobacteraceae bacterium]|nr:BatD family protein [Arcobacteraceae bacterium]